MDLLELISGNRVNYSANVLGGVKIDINDSQRDALHKGMDFLEERTHHYMKIVTEDETFLGRTRNIGLMTKEQASLLGAVGPNGSRIGCGT